MLINIHEAAEALPLDRVYIGSAVLSNFKGKANVEVQLFRSNYDDTEIEQIRNLGLVTSRNTGIPAEALAGATEEAALKCLMEAFTKEECVLIANYLQERYNEQIERIDFAPLQLPLPLGLGPLAELPPGEKSGFVNFDKAPGYSLPFHIKGWYELD